MVFFGISRKQHHLRCTELSLHATIPQRWFSECNLKSVTLCTMFVQRVQTLLTHRSCPHSKLIQSNSIQTHPFFSHFSPFGWPVVKSPGSNATFSASPSVCFLSLSLSLSGRPRHFNVMSLNLGAHIKHTPPTSISKLAPCSALILSIVLVVLFLIRFYILQRFLLEKLHGSTYTQMDDITRRSFLNNYIAGTTKITILIIAFYPFVSVAFGTAAFSTPYIRGSSVTMGDLLLIAAQMLTGMFIFELIYRVRISPVSVAHHIGSIMIAQAAITISVKGDQESSIEFLLCTVWGKYNFHDVPSFSLES